jgi:hypothetical protein
MNEETLADLAARLDKMLRRFPEGAACRDCGERNRLVLCTHRRRVVCQQCRLVRQGRPTVEEHHLGGRPGRLTAIVPANLHRLLTLAQELWRGTLKAGSPEAQLFDLALLRILGPSFGCEVEV